MKRLIYKFLIVCIMLVLAVSTITITENIAATYSFSFTGPTQASSGDTLTYTITANGLTGNVKLSGSNVTLSANQTWVEKNTVTITAKVNGFPASVTATPVELTDNDYNIVTLSPRTIEISEKKVQVTPPPTVQPSQPETSSGQTNGGTQQGNGSSNQGGTSNQGQSSSPQPSNQGQGSGTQSNNQGTSQNQQTRPQNNSQVNKQTNNQGSSQTNNQNEIKSSNNYLKNLQVNVGTLSPEFYRETYEYTVDNIIEDDIEISAEAEDEKAIINGVGTVALNGGENRINIEVIAENEQARTYTIIVNKLEQVVESDMRLNSLQIQTINENNLFEDLDIGFNKEILDYETTVEDNVTDLSVLATVDKEGIIVDVDGDKNLKEGENIVTITLTNQNENNSELNDDNESNREINDNENDENENNNGNNNQNNNENSESKTNEDVVEKTVYTIKVNRKAKPIVEVSSNKVSNNQIIAGILLVLVTVGLVMIAITTHIRKSNEKNELKKKTKDKNKKI